MASKNQVAGKKKTKDETPKKQQGSLSNQEKKDLAKDIKNLEDENKRLSLENVMFKNNFHLRDIIKVLSQEGRTELDGIEMAKDMIKMALQEAENKHSAEKRDMEMKNKKLIEKLSQNLQGADHLPTQSKETTQLQAENKYLKLLLDDLHKSIIVGEPTLQMELKPPEDIRDDKLLIELTTNTNEIHLKFYKLETELDYIHKRISQLTSMIVGDDISKDPTQEKINKFAATGRQPKRNTAKTIEQREKSSKLDQDIELVTSAWRNLKEKEILRNDFEIEKDQLKDLNTRLKDENTKLRKEADSLRTSLRNDFEIEKDQFKDLNTRLKDENFKLRKEADSLRTSLRNDFEIEKDQLKDLNTRLKDENTKLRKEADSLRARLSEHTGALLYHDKPAIADLSDPNRATKLAETYLELYDNEWTDAFCKLETEYWSASDEELYGHLYNILVDGYVFCKDARQAQIVNLQEIMFNPTGDMSKSRRSPIEEASQMFSNSLSDAAKLSSKVTSVNIAKAFVTHEETKRKHGQMIKVCETYIQKCLQLCWHMQVQTPPLCLDLITTKGHAFEKNNYKEYTIRGKKIAFVVWPALFLHENGPLLSKGVAQGD